MSEVVILPSMSGSPNRNQTANIAKIMKPTGGGLSGLLFVVIMTAIAIDGNTVITKITNHIPGSASNNITSFHTL